MTLTRWPAPIADGLFLDDPSGDNGPSVPSPAVPSPLAGEQADHKISEALRHGPIVTDWPEPASEPAPSSTAIFRLAVRIARSGADVEDDARSLT